MRIRGKTAIAVEWTVLGITVPFLVSRLFVRYRMQRLRWLSDGIVTMTWLLFMAGNICDYECYRKGLFQEDISYTSDWSMLINNDQTIQDIMKITFASQFIYYAQLWTVKLSVLLFYFQLIPEALPKLRKALYVIGAFVTVAYVAINLVLFCFCMPIKKNWEVSEGPGTCHSFNEPLPYATAFGFHLVSDILIYILPFFLLHYLTFNSRRKLFAVVAIFAVGFICVAITLARGIVIGVAVNVPTFAVWTAVEQGTGILVICLPALRVLIWRRHNDQERGTRLVTRPTNGINIFSWCSLFVLTQPEPSIIANGTAHTHKTSSCSVFKSRRSSRLSVTEQPEWIRMETPPPAHVKEDRGMSVDTIEAPISPPPDASKRGSWSTDRLCPLPPARIQHNHTQSSSLNESLARSNSMNESVEILRNDILAGMKQQARSRSPLGMHSSESL